jgi:hypothetical protein
MTTSLKNEIYDSAHMSHYDTAYDICPMNNNIKYL